MTFIHAASDYYHAPFRFVRTQTGARGTRNTGCEVSKNCTQEIKTQINHKLERGLID
jgi:hypothetical protein